jgi:FlaA1/EpsC-like NDP-sugar epimerase
VKGDIQSLDLVLHLLASEEVDTVMHFAAQVPLLEKSCCVASCL